MSQGVSEAMERSMKVIDAKIQTIEDRRSQAVCALLEEEIQKEFDKVHRRKPHWTKILFGNGTYLIVGMEDNEDPWSSTLTYRASLSRHGGYFEQKWTGPDYLYKLFCLLDMASKEGLSDIEPRLTKRPAR